MSDQQFESQQHAPRAPSRGRVVLPTLFLLATITAIDLCAVILFKLEALRIPYFIGLHLAPFVIPGGCALVWLRTRHSHPWLGNVLPILVCCTVICAIPGYVESKIARIYVPGYPWGLADQLEAKLGFPVTMENSDIIVAPANAERTREELKVMGLLTK